MVGIALSTWIFCGARYAKRCSHTVKKLLLLWKVQLTIVANFLFLEWIDEENIKTD